MNTGKLLRLLALPLGLTLAVSCSSVEEPAPSRTVSGSQSLDQPPARFTPGVTDTEPQTGPTGSVDDVPTTSTTTTTTTTDTPTTTSPTPPIDTPPVTPKPPVDQPAAPSYGKPVPGRTGFVYPPGVDSKPENMVDVRDFTPGQKVRDPRTGKIFLVP